MSKYHSFYNTVDQIVTYGVDKGILHLYTNNQSFDGTGILINDKPVLNFGSCSYLGLEFDPRINTAAKEAIDKYGTQFSESRAYVSLGLYRELEELMDKLFDAHCVIVPTTTLGHIACIPVIIEDADAIILDQQVHNSVQTAVQLVKARGVHVELVRHNRMDLLEERIKELRSKHKKIWYMADGIYSMFGDCSPVEIIYSFMDKYPELHYYVDDAHGMSIHGKHGRGFILSKHAMHAKMMMATSLNKAFASGGGALIFGDKELARKVGTVGGPLLSSGPMQPSALGAAIASAKIHLSDEIIKMQAQLRDNIQFTILLLKKFKLPVISEAGAAIFFVGVSLPKLGHNIVKQMLDSGFYVNLGVFPTVPMKQTGIRFTITRLHSFKEIESMITELASVFPIAMAEEGITLPEIYKAFKVSMPEEVALNKSVERVIKQSLFLKADQYKSIQEIDKSLWDFLFRGKGTFDWENLLLLENSFLNNSLPEDNWLFDYLIIKDMEGNIVVATFFTTTLWKDDMLSPGIVSKQVEAHRKDNPYYLTSKVICAGSLITEGEHVYIDISSSLYKAALELLFEKVYALQELYKANQIVLRDFQNKNEVIDNLMVDNGFFKIQMPQTHAISNLSWNTLQDFHHSLSSNSRRQMRKKVLRFTNKFKTEIITSTASKAELTHWYNLYLNVKNNNYELNTFTLPTKFFEQLNQDDNWEVIQLTLAAEKGLQLANNPCCVIFSHKSTEVYIPMIIGVDYTHNPEFNIYRQGLYQIVIRAKELGKEKILLGFSATIEKQKIGAIAMDTFAYLHTNDSYNIEVLSAIASIEKNTL